MAHLSKSASARIHKSRSNLKRHSVAQRSVANPEKVLLDKLHSDDFAKEIIKRTTLGLYSLKTKDSSYGIPFAALSDALALTACKELLPIANVYKVGTFCLHDGKCTSLRRPVLVLDNKVS